MKRQKSFEKENAKLYLVATPIGNLEDITFRAVKTLNSVDIIYCEDTRTSRKLLDHYKINTKLKSVHLFNENEISQEIIRTVKEGLNVAIISDAGMPVISDPGWIVTKEAIEQDIDIIVVPGASAGISALIASGITAHPFYFAGFLNSKSSKRRQELKELYNREETIVFYESPHRIEETLKILVDIYPNRKITLARELTKLHEEYIRGTAIEILEVVDSIKGEMVVIMEGNSNPIEEHIIELNELTIEEHYKHYIDSGIDHKEALKKVANDRHISKKEVYEKVKK
ncbi:MAG: 16S rRNA (cytidine(1402)-2'-O)-methyltransferase [Bacilli bacterium]|nr:16S rRNA (cytidine(1402)-2'-O)-methyltransferase [Bacilli bacterium]